MFNQRVNAFRVMKFQISKTTYQAIQQAQELLVLANGTCLLEFLKVYSTQLFQ